MFPGSGTEVGHGRNKFSFTHSFMDFFCLLATKLLTVRSENTNTGISFWYSFFLYLSLLYIYILVPSQIRCDFQMF